MGNSLSYAILHGTYQEPPTLISNNGTSAHNVSDSNVSKTLYEYCGKHDCQNASIIAKSLHQYVPHSNISVYMFIMSTVLLTLVAIVIHCTTFPGVGTFSHKLKKIDNDVKQILLIPNDEHQPSSNNDHARFISNVSKSRDSNLSTVDDRETKDADEDLARSTDRCRFRRLRTVSILTNL